MGAEKTRAQLLTEVAELESRLDTLEAEKAGWEADSEWHHFLDLLPDIVYRIDRHGYFEHVNSAVRILGYEPEDLIGQHFSVIIDREDLDRVCREPVLARLSGQVTGRANSPKLFDERRTRENMTRDLEVRLRSKHAIQGGGEGTGILASIFSIGELAATGCYDPHVDAPEKVFVGTIGIIRNITERKLREERERQAEKMQAFGQLAGGVAHDFNNQLVGIMGFADLLRTELRNSPLSKYVDGILDSARSARELTLQLLAFARKGQRTSSPVDLHKTVADVVALLERTVDKRVRIKQTLNASPATTLGDGAQLQNAILNVALNACHAMPEGGALTFETSIADFEQSRLGARLLELPAGRYVCVATTDDGWGMEKEVQARIFEPFFTTRPPGEGTGMGLAAVLGTVKSHGGAVFVYSEPGRGTTVKLYLPLLTESEDDATACSRPPVALETGSATVLFVDDEIAVRDVGSEMLEFLGYRVRTCVNGAEALARYSKEIDEIDLVLLDLTMPELGGKDCFEALRKIDPEVRVVIMSGFSADSTAENMLRQGVKGFLQKPFEHAEIARMVAAALED